MCARLIPGVLTFNEPSSNRLADLNWNRLNGRQFMRRGSDPDSVDRSRLESLQFQVSHGTTSMLNHGRESCQEADSSVELIEGAQKWKMSALDSSRLRDFVSRLNLWTSEIAGRNLKNIPNCRTMALAPKLGEKWYARQCEHFDCMFEGRCSLDSGYIFLMCWLWLGSDTFGHRSSR